MLDSMQIHRIHPSEVSNAFELLVASGWGHRLDSLSTFASLVEASQIAEVAVMENRVVGFVRGISGGISNGYISMLVVESSHRGRGIGRRLVEHVIGKNTKVTWVLRAGREGAAEFFAKVGFQASSIAMERQRE